MSKYGVISGPYFTVFELNTDIYSVNKKRTRKKLRICTLFTQGDAIKAICECVIKIINKNIKVSDQEERKMNRNHDKIRELMKFWYKKEMLS